MRGNPHACAVRSAPGRSRFLADPCPRPDTSGTVGCRQMASRGCCCSAGRRGESRCELRCGYLLAVSMTAGLATYPGARGSGAASTYVAVTAPTVALSVAPADFSPNHDGRRDTTTISVTPDRPVDLTLSVKRPSGALVRTLALDRPIDATTSMTWRGLNDAMRHAPDGRYLVVARVVDPASGQTAREKRRVVIDTVPPSLTGLRVSPEPWTGTGSVHLGFRLTDAGPGASLGVRVGLQDVAGRRVRHVTHLVRKRGIQSVTWNPRKPWAASPPTAATRSFFGRPTKPAIGGRAVQRRSGLLGRYRPRS